MCTGFSLPWPICPTQGLIFGLSLPTDLTALLAPDFAPDFAPDLASRHGCGLFWKHGGTRIVRSAFEPSTECIWLDLSQREAAILAYGRSCDPRATCRTREFG